MNYLKLVLFGFVVFGVILFLLGALTATHVISRGLGYDAANIVGATLFCSGIIISLIGLLGLKLEG